MAEENSVGKTFGYGMCNPVIKKMAKKSHTLEMTKHEATYKGIAGKTIYFLILCVVGFAAFFVLHNIFMQSAESFGGVLTIGDVEELEGIMAINTCVYEALVFIVAGIIVLFTPLMAWLIRPTIPVVGTLYAICEGYFIGAITEALTADYKWISLVAFILTAAIVSVMLFLYVKRIVKVTKKFKTVLSTLFLVMIFGGIAIFLLSFVPFLRPIIMGITTFMNNPIISIGMSVLYIVIAALFLLVDFDVIEECVEQKMPKKLEWMAAFGLVYTVIYIYFKILNLILQLTSRGNRE
ncbi:MAG: Bax inhibitor-1/YccA family protein [Clostridia bacterium]|nr:Bax inhibitor-1/YccA family protein [Lachnospiraceae bacterium]NCC00984.1 Bax inhibitor-1/YccA family protein [Clostridia bacterium]NCD03436.1 Bax inhibitor-1/YccA family protein [Clostridia bacterium]